MFQYLPMPVCHLNLALASLPGAPSENYLEWMEQNLLDHNERDPSMKMASKFAHTHTHTQILTTMSSKKSRNSATLFCKQASKANRRIWEMFCREALGLQGCRSHPTQPPGAVKDATFCFTWRGEERGRRIMSLN